MNRNKSVGKRKSEWISSSFGDAMDFCSQGSSQNTITLNEVNDSLPANSDRKPWTEKYKPFHEDDLAVNKKKILEVRTWLVEKVNRPFGKGGVGLLLLTGPSGSGKTAVLDVLSKEMNFQLREWINPVSQDYTEKLTGNYGNWWDSMSSTISQSQQFHDFLFRANRYNGLVMIGDKNERSNKTVVLVEDLPNFILCQPKKLHELLRQYLITGRTPLIFIMSDNNSDSMVHSIFPKNIQNEFGIVNISFNPVSATNLKKTISKVVSSEIKNDPSIIDPSKETIGMLSESCNGDIRSCINYLQFFCTNCDPKNPKPSRKPVGATSLKRKKNISKKASKEVHRNKDGGAGCIGGRDNSLFLFHALGKILYCKRSVLKKSDRLSQLPTHLSRFTRDSLQVNPEEVFERTQVTSDTFLLYLHENYLDFFHDIDDVSTASLSITDADIMNGIWSQRQILSDYTSSISMRGIMFSKSSSNSSSGKWRQLHKPQWFDSFKTKNNRQMVVNHLFHETRYSPVELCTEIFPYSYQMKVGSKTAAHQTVLEEISSFSTKKFQQSFQTSSSSGRHMNFGIENQTSRQHRQSEIDHTTCDDDEEIIEDFDD